VRRPDKKSTILRGLAAGLLAIASLLLMSGSALGAFSHSLVENTFPVGEPCNYVLDIAVLESDGLVYIACEGATQAENSIKRFNLDGTPAPFIGNAPYITGNTLTGDPGSDNGTFVYKPDIAVDNSASPNHGRLFVTSSPNLSVFAATGLRITEIRQPNESTIDNRLDGIDVGPDGSIYLTSGNPAGRVSKYTPQFVEVKRLYSQADTFFDQFHIRIDTTGALWGNAIQNGFPNGLRKWEADQFTEELKPQFGIPVPDFALAKRSPYADDPVIARNTQSANSVDFTTPLSIDVDLSDNDVYVAIRRPGFDDRIETYSQGTPEEKAHRNAPIFGQGVIHFTPFGGDAGAIALTADHHVYAASKEASNTPPEIIVFGPGDILPDIRTEDSDLEEVGHTSTQVHGEIELAGGSNIVDCKIEYGTVASTAYGSSIPCEPNPAESPPGSNFSADTQIDGEITGLTTGTQYHYRITAENEEGQNTGIERFVVPAFVLKTRTLPATNLNQGGATLNASFDPDGLETTYKFQYGLDGSYGFETAPTVGGSGFGIVNVSTPVSGLPSGKLFHYRVVATNENGTTFGPDETFRTASPPDIAGVRTTEVTATSAVLHAKINPVGFSTDYQFEYGTTPEFGKSIPINPFDIGSGEEAIDVHQTIEGLEPGVTHYFRVVAENEWGTNASSTTTFDFSPPSCPNDHVRQQTAASYLPDCRAYELVSPGDAGSGILLPSNYMGEVGSNTAYSIGETAVVQNQGYATSPSRFSFYTAISTVGNLDAPVGLYDMFMSTRTTDGWVTEVPGLQGTEAFTTSRKECTEALDLCLDHSSTDAWDFTAETAPYVFTASGEPRGRLPTNVHVVPGGTRFGGAHVISADAGHFAFSSTELSIFGEMYPGAVFAPGGVSTGLGSAYDNDVAARTVTIISKYPNGENLELEGPRANSEEAIVFRGISADGSHILMQTPGVGGKHLFMRVNQAMTYEIANRAPVQPIGMTRDGGKVFFTTSEQLTENDTDSSTDLYMWEENGDQLTRLSQGNGNGDTDSCSAGSWGVSGCGVLPLNPERAHPNSNQLVSIKGQDDLFAENAGDIYFYSPELLDPSNPGIQNERNLYVYRNGGAQLVGTFDEGTEVKRMQVSPDGKFAAMLTDSQLTSFNNLGWDQVYSYDVDANVMLCASCNPSGLPPSSDATTSGGGRFMANDGRTFFSTKDALVARDQNGEITDTYEYVGGRPQLISSGLGSRDFTGGGETLGLFIPEQYIGLEAVSRDGTDVYFSTMETLLPEDNNGEFVKFYDARTGGGFPRDPALANCAAADECHGLDSSPPDAPAIASGAVLGARGNVADDRCESIARQAKKNSNRARRLRRKASNSSNGKQSRRLRKSARGAAKEARRLRKQAEACRRSSGGNG
jgi:hypothetical protein